MPKTPVVKRIHINPSLISLKPRQVLLAKPNMNTNEASVPILKPEQKALLLRSIAGYLKSNGFSQTLKKFLSEAELEKDDFSASSLDLERMCCKFLMTCDQRSTNLTSQKVQDIQVDGNSKRGEEADIVAGVETVNKKKKKKNDDDSHVKMMHSEDSANLTVYNGTEKQISKEKRKNKKILESLTQTAQVNSDLVKKPATDVVSESHLSEPDKKHKDKKKKKGKLDSESPLSNVEPIVKEDKRGTEAKESKPIRDFKATETAIVNSNNISVEDQSVKSKGKKKKKDSSTLCHGDSEEIDEQKSGGTESKDDSDNACEEDAADKEGKGSKKRKRSVSEENSSEPIEKKEVEESKRRKTESSEKPMGSGEITEMNESVGTNGHFGKEVKGENDKVNVNVEKKGEKSAPNKSSKKLANGSAEPKTAKAFQRVKVDEVVFIDERLKDNSYWAKDGAESGYGAKAQEVLGQVRGRDFRHEKTKKKRGSYRGGLIDLQSHSVKFNYSDDE